jgi:hypothetical protein
MIPTHPQWPGFQLPFPRRASEPPAIPLAQDEVPDHHTQLEELLGHVRRCERWARLDDLIDLHLRLDGEDRP